MLITILKPDFQFKDDRGLLVQLVHGGYNQVNYITSRGGVVRGNHYHKFNNEAFYVVSGSFILDAESLRDEDNGATERHIFNTGDMFSIPPYVNHSFDYKEDTVLISMYSSGVELNDGSKDMWTVE